jgi:hypothetical protein
LSARDLACGFGNAEVDEFCAAIEGDENIARAYVAVHDAKRAPLLVGAPVRMLETAAYLGYDLDAGRRVLHHGIT